MDVYRFQRPKSVFWFQTVLNHRIEVRHNVLFPVVLWYGGQRMSAIEPFRLKGFFACLGLLDFWLSHVDLDSLQDLAGFE